MSYKKVVFAAITLAFVGMAATTSTAYAQQTPPTGKVKAVTMDGGGFMVELHQIVVPGNCGSNLFRIAMTKPGYKEMVAIMLGAYLGDKHLGLWVERCDGNVHVIFGGASWP